MPILLTHSGPFHADDLVAYLVLARTLGDVRLVRSRAAEAIVAADVVFDVGGEYDPTRHRYDHHQPGGAGQRDNGVPYASAGLACQCSGCRRPVSASARRRTSAGSFSSACGR